MYSSGHRLVRADRFTLIWTSVALVLAAPVLVTLSLVLWRTPFPLSEGVALLEDAVRNWPVTSFPVPDQSYYRPLFYIALGAIWDAAGSLPAGIAGIKLLQIVPLIALVALFLACTRPRTGLDAAAAVAGIAVLLGSPGLADNLEIPLSYTIVGMPLALAAWILVSGEPRWWRSVAVVVCTLVAIGFKEQGLVVAVVVLAAWWTGAPGATRRLALATACLASAYVLMRLAYLDSASAFEQSIGIGFSEIDPPEAVARYGAFPYPVYAYSGLATMLNVLLSEPSRGVFRITAAAIEGRLETWQMIHAGSSLTLTLLIAWWGVRCWRRRQAPDAEVGAAVALVASLLACGVLSFAYSRARLGGMAVPFYALAAFFAIRAAVQSQMSMRPWRVAIAAAGLLALVAAWQVRAVSTVEYARLTATRNHREWLTRLPDRRREYADRALYLDLMERLVPQGTAASTPLPTRYPEWMIAMRGEP